MAELNFGTTSETTPEISSSIIDEGSSNPSTQAEINSGVKGLSQEELNDVSKITVNIADKTAPVVVLFGSPASGKTMTLVRLTRFLQSEGYSVSPVRSFRPNYDENYQNLCDNFNTLINSNDAAASTSRISFMLVNVVKNGRTICQLMEAPGEHYFYPEFPNEPFPRYLHKIIASENRKIWMFMVEPVHTNKRMPALPDRKNYVNKIAKLKTKMSTKDKSIFIYNKIDETQFIMGKGVVKVSSAIKDVQDNYPNIFEPFRNQNPITRFFSEYRFDFVPFMTGEFSKASDGTYAFEEGPKEYPKKLWEAIMNKVRG